MDDKQVSLEINQSAEREMLRLWRRGGGWGVDGGGAGGKATQSRQLVIFLNGLSVMRFGQRGLTWH